MPATRVYSVQLKDEFKFSDGTLTVQEFLTPKNHTQPWKARVTNDAGEELILEVHDLEKMEKVQ